jgi:hypothetical protein
MILTTRVKGLNDISLADDMDKVTNSLYIKLSIMPINQLNPIVVNSYICRLKEIISKQV